MAFSWNPFKTNKFYFIRSYKKLIQEFYLFLAGYGDGIYRLGILDYLLILPLILLVFIRTPWVIPNSKVLFKILNLLIVFLLYTPTLVLKHLIAFLITLISLPFLFIYHELSIFTGKPIKKLLDDLELLEFKHYPSGMADYYNLMRLEEPPPYITYETMSTLDPADNDGNSVVIFNDNSMYFIDKKNRLLHQIKHNPYSGINQLVASLKKNQMVAVFRDDRGYFEIEKAICEISLFSSYEPNPPLDFDTFYKVFYDNNEVNSCTQKKVFFPEDIHLRVKPMSVLTKSNEYRLILAFYYRGFFPYFFIVPSKKNKAFFNALIDEKSIGGIWIEDHKDGLLKLSKALDEEDPFHSETELRIETTTLLIKALCPNIKSRKRTGNQGFDISTIITSYIGLPTLNKTLKEQVDRRCSQNEENETKIAHFHPM